MSALELRTLLSRPRRRALATFALAAAATPAGAAAVWTDGFETYPVGQFPNANWSFSGNSQIQVTNSTSDTGSKALLLYGVIGGDWAALAHRQFAYAPDLLFGFSVKNGSEPLHGVHQVYGAVQLNTGPSWTTPGRSLIAFGQDGLIHAGMGPTSSELSGPVLQSYTAGNWYDVKIKYHSAGSNSISLTYWIDGHLDGTYAFSATAAETGLSYLGLVSGAGSAWFDNVSVSAVPEPSAFGLLCIGGFGLWLRRRSVLAGMAHSLNDHTAVP